MSRLQDLIKAKKGRGVVIHGNILPRSIPPDRPIPILSTLSREDANTAAINHSINLASLNSLTTTLSKSHPLIIDPSTTSIDRDLDKEVGIVIPRLTKPTKFTPTITDTHRTSLSNRLAQIKESRNISTLAANISVNKTAELSLIDRLKLIKEKSRSVTLDMPVIKETISGTSNPIPTELVQRGKDEITFEDLNDNQKRGVSLAEQGVDYCLIGGAGSGKTTTTREMALALESSGQIKELGADTKVLSSSDPSILFVSFTNQAVSNIRDAVPDNFKSNCLTIHKLLEYEPIFFTVYDPATGEDKPTMRYEPARTSLNPITGITHIVVEEAGSVGVELFHNLQMAVPADVTWIFLGDLNQLPPVFGDAILGFKLLELPVVELLHSYRTDTTSPIRLLAYDILAGKPIRDTQLDKKVVPGELELIRFKDRVESEHAIKQIGTHFQSLILAENEKPGTGFNYLEDVILVPFNKKLGTIELNKYIAQQITEINGVPTYEIIVGFIKKYYAVGDIVYLQKTKWRIVEIKINENYIGKTPTPASTDMDRWGEIKDPVLAAELRSKAEELSAEDMLERLANEAFDTENGTSFRQASHKIVLEDLNGDRVPLTVGDCASMNEIYLAYALTVHKSQGSEWNKVYCIFHHSHGVMMKREILYTAITRARKFLRVYYSGEDPRKGKDRKVGDSTFHKGIVKQDLPGNCLEDKLDYFRKKLRALAMKNELDRIKGTEKKFNKANVDLDGEIAKKLLYQLTHGLGK